MDITEKVALLRLARPVLEDMPPHVLEEIHRNLTDFFDNISFRNVSPSFRKSIRRFQFGVLLEISYNESDEAEVNFFCYETGHSKVKKYTKNEQGWLVTTTFKLYEGEERESSVQGGQDLLEMMIQDFKSILDLPVVRFFLTFKLEEGFGMMPRIKEILSTLEEPIKVQTLEIGTKDLDILTFLDPEAMTSLSNSRDGPPHSMGSLDLDRFLPTLEHVSLRNLSTILPVENWWNVRNVDIGINANCSTTESLAQLPRIIQHFRQTPAAHEWNIFLKSSDSEIKNAIGDFVQWEVIHGEMGGSRETFHLPADGSNFGLYCQVGHGFIDFFRNVQTVFWF